MVAVLLDQQACEKQPSVMLWKWTKTSQRRTGLTWTTCSELLLNKLHKLTTQASKSTGETGEGSKAVGIPPTDDQPQPQASTSTGAIQNPTQDPTMDPPPQPQQPLAPTDNPPQPQASTSTADTQDPTENPEEEKDPTLIAYVKSYQEAGKVWLDTVEESKEQAYKMLFDKLLVIGDPHIPKFSDADRKTVLDCIADKSGKYLSEDEFAVYVSREEVRIDKKRYAVSDEEKAVIRDYYDKAKDLCDAQAAFMQSTCTLADNIKNKEAIWLYAELFLGHHDGSCHGLW